MKPDHFGRISLFIALAITLVTCISAHGQQVPLFDPPQQSVSPEIQLFEATPMLDLFQPQPATAAPLDLFANRGLISPKSGLPDHAPEVAIFLPSPTLTDTRQPPRQTEGDDERPTVHAYSISRCIPCKISKESTGSGDSRVRVQWHDNETGEMHPYAVHIFGLKHGYPVYHYQSPKGHWEFISGGRTMDAVAELVKSDSQIVNR